MVDPHRIAVIPGDGIGKDVLAEGLKALEALRSSGLALNWEVFDLGADRFLHDGTTYPEEIAGRIRGDFDAVLLGALGDPRVPDLGYARDILFGLRFGLDLYCNIRPVQCLHERLMPLKAVKAEDCDFVVFRENTEGLYSGVGGWFKKDTPDEVAINESVNTRRGVERIIRAAFEFAKQTGRSRVHMADKSNALKFAHGLWRRCFDEVAQDYPDIEAHHVYVDALCLYLIQDPSPFEVIVTCNLFGDIVTDLAAGLQGGMGMAGSANVHPGRVSMFEPVHGSAPPLAGTGRANPLATILTIGMMLSHLGHPEREAQLLAVVTRAIAEKRCTPDVGGEATTSEVGDWVAEQVARGYSS